MQGYASGFLPTPPHSDAVASGSELAPPLPPGDFHPQSIAHAGRLNVGLDGRFAEYAAQVVGGDIVVVCDPGRARDTRLRLARVGLDSVVGALDQPESAFVEHPEAAGTASRLTARQLAGARAAVPGLVLLDVRGPGEREMGCIEDSVHIPLGQLRDRVGELDPARPVVTYCAGGYRSSIAASLLRASGFADVSDLIGGYQAWQAAA